MDCFAVDIEGKKDGGDGAIERVALPYFPTWSDGLAHPSIPILQFSSPSAELSPFGP